MTSEKTTGDWIADSLEKRPWLQKLYEIEEALREKGLARPEYFDREGEEISYAEWAILFENPEYKIIVQTEIGPYWVSTIWLGMDHGFGYHHDPIIFETMVFRTDNEESRWNDLEQMRYCTEEQARTGHEETVSEVELFVRLGDEA